MKREVKLNTVKRGQVVEYLAKYKNREPQLVRGIVISKKSYVVELLELSTEFTWLIDPDNIVSVDE